MSDAENRVTSDMLETRRQQVKELEKENKDLLLCLKKYEDENEELKKQVRFYKGVFVFAICMMMFYYAAKNAIISNYLSAICEFALGFNLLCMLVTLIKNRQNE